MNLNIDNDVFVLKLFLADENIIRDYCFTFHQEIANCHKRTISKKDNTSVLNYPTSIANTNYKN